MRTRTVILGYVIGVLMVAVFFATVMGKIVLPIGVSVFATLFAALIANRFWD